MGNSGLTKSQKVLLFWSAGLLLSAEAIKRLRVEGRAATIVGLIELLLAIATGIAFGISATADSK